MVQASPPVALPVAEAVQHAADLIAGADALVVTAGAGMGVDSGLPDFRGSAGFWGAYPALGAEGIDFYSIACPDAFFAHPARAWGFYGHRLALYRATTPHAGFGILRGWGHAMRHGLGVFTSNVDGQFQKAGFGAGPVHECHGSLHHLQCLHGCHDATWSADTFTPDVDTERCLLRGPLPVCPRCTGLARPNVLMFGDAGWLDARHAAQERALSGWLSGVARPVVVEIGAGTAVATVRQFSEWVVRARGGRLVRINPRESQVASPKDVGIAADALPALMAIDRALCS